MKKSIYIESTIPSYATARTSRDLVIAGKQAQTQDFWNKCRYQYKLWVSPVVIAECSDGDNDAAQRRLEIIKDIEQLSKPERLEELAGVYQNLMDIPDRAKNDCLHLAYCVLHRIDMLLTWNCTHLGTASYIKLRNYNDKHDLWTPALVTPDTIVGFEKEKEC